MHEEYGPGMYIPPFNPETGEKIDLELVAQTLADMGIARSIFQPAYQEPLSEEEKNKATNLEAELLRYDLLEEGSLGFTRYDDLASHFESQGLKEAVHAKLWQNLSKINSGIVSDKKEQDKHISYRTTHLLSEADKLEWLKTHGGEWMYQGIRVMGSVSNRLASLPFAYQQLHRSRPNNKPWEIVEQPFMYVRVKQQSGPSIRRPLQFDLFDPRNKNFDRSELFVSNDVLYAILKEQPLAGAKADKAAKGYLNKRIIDKQERANRAKNQY